jgi:uncharacterized protein (TIGR01777 family)
MNNRQTILITGGTGLIGSALSTMLLDKGYDVTIVTRKIPHNRFNDAVSPMAGQEKGNSEKIEGKGSLKYALWNIDQQTIDEKAIQTADHIIHLAGANVGERRWTAKRKKEILESRTRTSALLVKALKGIPNNIQSVVTASAIGWYGEDMADKIPFHENAPAAKGFLGETCKAWEESINPVEQIGKRLIKLRTGIVLSNQGGALQEFKKPLRFGLATILGNGQQIISWIHITDLCRIYCYVLEREELHGVYNAVSPQPESNKKLILELGKKTRGKFFVPVYVPTAALRLALGEMSIEVLKSTTVSNQKIRQAGFRYIYPTLQSAIDELTNH